MPTWTALTLVSGKPEAQRISEDLEHMQPTPYGVAVIEV